MAYSLTEIFVIECLHRVPTYVGHSSSVKDIQEPCSHGTYILMEKNMIKIRHKCYENSVI